MKKLLATLMALAMTLTLCTVAFGDEKEVTDGASLKSAIETAADGDTIKLTDNVTIDSQIVIDKTITIDLGGKTLTSTWVMPSDAGGEGRYALLAKNTLTVQNGTFAAGQARALGAYGNLTLTGATITSELTGGHACVAFCTNNGSCVITNSTLQGDYGFANFANAATITISGGKIAGRSCGLYHNGTNHGLNLTVTGTTITGGATAEGVGTATDTTGVYVSGSLTTTATNNGVNQQVALTNCTVSAATAVEVKFTDLTLTNCNLTATAEPQYNQNNNGATSSGFAVIATDNKVNHATPSPVGKITIKGGTYDGIVGLSSFKNQQVPEGVVETDYVISEGNFSNPVNPTFLADGYDYEVRTSGDTPYSYHKTFDEAMEVAETDGGTVTNLEQAGDHCATFTIAYNDGTNRTVAIYSSMTNPDIPMLVRDGYTFKGWMLADMGQSTPVGPLSVEEVKKMVAEDTNRFSDGVSLTAVWEKIPARYYYNSTTTTDTKKDEGKTSPKTFDAGMGIYTLTAVLSVTGMAYVGKKKF